MKNLLRPLLLAAVAGTLGLSACSESHKYGATNVEDGSTKKIDGDQTNFTGDSVVAGLHRNNKPSQQAAYDSASDRVDRNHDGKSDK